MPNPVLEDIDHAAEALAENVIRSKPGWRSLWQITGPPAVGKSACLERTADLLAKDGSVVPVLVSPSPHHLDVAAVAMTDVAVGLAEGGVIDGELGQWNEPGTWSERIGDLQRWIGANSERVVLLLDAPRSWGGDRDEDNFFAGRGRETALTLAMSQCRRVITGRSNLPIEPTEKVVLDRPRPETAWLEDADAWGELAPCAIALRESEIFSHAKTPLSVRLLVAAISLTSLKQVESWAPDRGGGFDAYALVALLAETMRERNKRAWDMWQRFSFTRRSFDGEVFDQLVGNGSDGFIRDLTRHCLLFGDEVIQMHDALRLNARRWQRENPAAPGLQSLRRKANKALFEIHRDRFARFSGDHSPAALSESVEAYHFASVLGGADFVDAVSPLFVDQLDALGWSLSYEQKKYGRAVETFEKALEWDPRDDYAHHYLAYNLYRQGKRLDDVEAHYRSAVEIRPDHPWWRSRLIAFLIDRGRVGEARTLWDDTELTLGLGESDVSVGTYEHLHCWVAGSLLENGEPYLARRILNGVPEWAREKVDSYELLSRRADALLELGDGHAVVPAWRLRSGWWVAGPELLQARIGAGRQAKRRMRWLAARVEERDEKGLHLLAALVEDEGEPEMTRTILDRSQYERFSRDEVPFDDLSVGSFLELGLYAASDTGADAETIVRVVPERIWETPRPPLDPQRRRDREPSTSR